MQDTLGYLSFLNANPTKATIARTIHINQSTSWPRPPLVLDSGGTRTGRFGLATAIIGATSHRSSTSPPLLAIHLGDGSGRAFPV